VAEFARWKALPPTELGVAAAGDQDGIVTVWRVEGQGRKGEKKVIVSTLGIDAEGMRNPQLERSV
jgi:hypothetical protein